MMWRVGPPEVKMEKMDKNGRINIHKDLDCDNTGGSNLENVRANVKVRGGKWYYEVKINSYGKAHIGWCTDKCVIQTNSYTGIGHDAESWGYDGSYQATWHGSTTQTRYGEYWSSGDTIGCLLDLDNKTINYYRNGKDMGVAFSNVTPGDGLHPAASVLYGQKISFNFGKEPFKNSVQEAFPDVHPLHLSITKDQQSSLEKLFEKYKSIGINMSESGETDDVIKGQGLLQYSQDLGITDEKDPGVLIIAWRLNARDKRIWEFSREAFVGGWALEGCFNVDGMKKKLVKWKEELKQDNRFRSFYGFVFDYLKEDKTILTLEEAFTVWELLGINEKRWPLMPKWLEYMGNKKSITRDAWRLFYAFTQKYPKGDFSTYNSEDDCWPTLIDDFVDLVKGPEKKKK